MKYELFGEPNAQGLRRIRALRDIPKWGVKNGDLGGWVETERNLSQDGDAWVCSDAWVCDNARVYNNAQVFGNSRVYGYAEVYGNAFVYGNAQVYDSARVSGDAWVCGDAWVYGDARVSGYARVYGSAQIAGTRDWLVIGPIGRDSGTLTAFRCKDGIVRVTRGCFLGTLDDLDSASAVDHVGEHVHHRAVYVAAIALIKAKFGA